MAEIKLRVISLGAGVQSTTLALMAVAGEIGPMPDAAIFADTGEEPQAVYDHLDRLDKTLPFPILRVGHGKLGDDLITKDEARAPFFTASGMRQRQCTRNYKLRPIRRGLRTIMAEKGIEPELSVVEQWIGISTDEAQRMKDSDANFVFHRWPLIEMRMSRRDCERWLLAHGHQIPSKSSCVFCPYRRNDQWRDMRSNDPVGWARAVEVDASLRSDEGLARLFGKTFVHRSLLPLPQAIEATDVPDDQLDILGFINECEGACGV